MNKFLLFSSILLIVGLVGSSSASAIQLPWQNNPSKAIPPTPAIMNVTTSNSTISSDTWNEVLNFIGLRGIDIFGSNNSKTVYFNVTIADENGTNLGTGAKVFKNETNHLWYFRTLHNGTNISVTSNSTGITISGTGSGESTTGSNIGSTGEGVFSALVGFDLQFKKLLAGTGISLSSNSTNITITNTATSSGFTKINNLDGGDAKVLATNSSLQATVKTLTAGSGVTITNGSKTITIAVTPGTDTNTAQIVSAGGTSIFKQRDNATQNTLYGLDSTRGIEFFTTSNTVDINTDFKVNSKTCAVGEHLFSFTNSTTGIGFTCTADTVGTAYNKINSLPGGTASLVATNHTLSNTQVTFKTLTQGTGISITNGSNTLTISSTITGGFTELNSINGGNARLLKSNSTNEGVFKSLTAARGISITNGTDTITIDAPLKVANQTQTKDQFIQAINNSTGIITKLQFSVNTQSCSAGQHVFSIDNSTGYVTCTSDSGGSGISKLVSIEGGNARLLNYNSTTTGIFKSLTAARGITLTNGSTTITIDAPLKVANQTSLNDRFVTGINNVTGIITTNTFSVNNSTCTGNQFIKQINNSTGFTVCATPASTGGSGYTKINSLDGGDAKIVATNTTLSNTQATFKTLTAGSGISITNGSKTLTITATGSGGGFTSINNMAGGNAKILATNASSKANFKSLTNGTGIKIINGSTLVTIEASGIQTKRWGSFTPTSATAALDGFLTTSTTLEGTETLAYNTTRGVLGIDTTTGAVGGLRYAGILQNATNFNIFRGDQNSYLWIEAAPAGSQFAGSRFFIGFKSSQQIIPRSDTIVDSISAFGICKRTTDTNYMRCENDGAGAGTYTSLGVAANANWHTFKVYATNNGASWCAEIDGLTASCATTDIPATTTRLYWEAVANQNPGTSVKTMRYGYVYVQNDK